MRSEALQSEQPTITILIIDDSETDCAAYTRYLQSDPNYHYQTLNGIKLREGMALWRSQPSDLVLLDMDLPDGDGLEFLKFLRADFCNEGLCSKVPVIVLVDQGDERVAMQAMKLGAMDYLFKEEITAISLRKSVLAAIDYAQLQAELKERQQAEVRLQQLNRELEDRIVRQIAALQRRESDHQQIQAELRSLSVRLTLALESAEIGTWDWDLVRDTNWDDRMYQLYGLEHLRRPATYQDWFNTLHPEDRAEVEQAFAQSLSEGKCDIEFRIILPDRTIRFVKTLGLMHYNLSGQPQHMVGVSYDITTRKQAEAALIRYTHEVEDLYNNAPCGYHSLDLKGRYIQVNETELRWLGYTREEMIGKPITEFFTEANRPAFFKNYEILRRQGWVKNLEYEMVCKNGSILPVLINAVVVKDEAGNHLYNRATILDIRERKAIESALQESEAKFRLMAENVPGMIFRYVFHSNGTDEFTYVSPYIREIYELEPDVVMQDVGALWSRIHPDDVAFIQTTTKESAESLQPFLVEHRLITPKAGIKWVHIISRPERQGNGDVVWNGVVQDITDRKMAEAKLQQTNVELAHATHLKDEFLANMSHELRTPLNAILGLSEALQEEILGVLNERQLKAIGTIEKSGRHLLELINDILDLSKISSGKMELHFEPVAVENLCSSSLLFVRQQAFKKNIQVTSDIPANVSNIIVDERRIRQVLINLLTNAVKFTPDEGQVSLKVAIGFGKTWQGNVLIPTQLRSQDAPLILFQVVDTGIGIAAADIARLFQPFVQIDSSLNREQMGTGLGLAMVKQITELHQGQVLVESCPGQGSHFTVALPYQMPIASVFPYGASVETPSPASVIPCAETAIAPLILLAEDNEANLDTFVGYLTARHYRVIVAKNGEEAVTLAKTAQPDVILMDMQMPKMDGIEAMRLIRSDKSLVDVPIIALTALAMTGDQERCMEAGANQYLSKPVGLKQLVEVIQQLLRS